MKMWAKHRQFKDVCLEVCGPIRFFGDTAVFKSRMWNLGQTGEAFPLESGTHREEISKGFQGYTLLTHPAKGLREAFHRKETSREDE